MNKDRFVTRRPSVVVFSGQCAIETEQQLFEVAQRIEARGRGKMGCDDHVGKRKQRIVGAPGRIVMRIEAESPQTAATQGIEQGAAVDEIGARDVDQDCTWFYRVELQIEQAAAARSPDLVDQGRELGMRALIDSGDAGHLMTQVRGGKRPVS